MEIDSLDEKIAELERRIERLEIIVDDFIPKEQPELKTIVDCVIKKINDATRNAPLFYFDNQS